MAKPEFSISTNKRRFNWPRIFGYDFFISFKLGSPPIGAQSYASDLARRLRELDYTVFFSEEEAPPGAQLDTTLIKALHRSKILVVIANEGALVQSQWVRKEVEEFRRKHPKRPVIPINVDNAIQTFGSQVEAALWLGYEGRIWLDESNAALNEGIISPEVFNRLQTVPRFTKANTRFKRMVTAIILLLLGLTLWAVREAYDAKLKFKEATAFRLTTEGNAMTTGARPGGQILGLLNVLAGHRILATENSVSAWLILRSLKQLAWHRQPSLANTYAALQTEYNRFNRLHFMRDTSSAVRSVAFSPDAKVIVSGSSDKTLRLWDAASGKAIGEPLKGHENSVSSVAFSPAAKVIVSGSSDNTLKLWDAATGKPMGEALEGHESYVNSVAFSPDGKVIVSGSFDNTLRLWDAETQTALGEPLKGHEDVVESVVFSPGGKMIVSSSFDNTLRLWDAATGKAIGEPLRGHGDGGVIRFAFNPEGKVIVYFGSKDRILRQFDVFEGWADALCHKLERNMSHKEWREQVSPDIEYIEQCPGLPIPPDSPSTAAVKLK